MEVTLNCTYPEECQRRCTTAAIFISLYLKGKDIMERKYVYPASKDSITAYSAELWGRLFFVFYLQGKWGKYTFAISKQDQKKNFLNYFSNQIK